MNIKILYNSYKGNTEFIAKCIGNKLGIAPSNISLKDIIPVKEFVSLINENSLEKRKERLILNNELQIENDTEMLFIGTPVWAHVPSPEVQGLLLNYLPNNVPIAVFYCHGGKPEGIIEEIEKMAPDNPIISSCDFRSPLMYYKNDSAKRAEKWAEETISLL
ncbi:conserved hypothetical protein [Methanolacinia petrolearia DSM 11571]|uniref:Flavodoxin-like domain-containing protein n=1 Tax=Methanolacinia petrolearia (strain DSM 11571 / OCM 486 / SEBR 4847) TaxID=679926 RepID=E1RI20_METP4|nr:hypothetical protein [Methanolacinia petrolearia]ADN35405.1 conserved hypothetical protein [Methanolacinia petrolearia DSM 11571]